MSSQPISVTVGITAYNATNYIEKCLQSIAEQTIPLHQVEVIIVDDGSTDDTVIRCLDHSVSSVAGSFRIMTQENTGGPAVGRNRILDEALGEFVFFVDADDYLGSEALGSMLSLGATDEADVVLGRFAGVNRGVPKFIFRNTLSRTSIAELPLTDSMNVLKMYRTSYARDLGYRFNSRLRMAEDHPFAMAAYAGTSRIAIQADVDCYFAVRHLSEAGRAQHITGHVLPVPELYAYMHETFGVLAFSDARRNPLAANSRAKYWERILTFDFAIEFRRKRDEAGRVESLEAAREIVALYGGGRYAKQLSSKANLVLSALGNSDHSLIRGVFDLIK